MSNYTPVTNFLSKDSLVSGNPLKALKGAELSTEFSAVQTAVNSKTDGSTTYFPDGTVAQPSVGFTNNAGTGMYNTAGQINLATGATLRLAISATGAITAASFVTANAGLTVANGAFNSRGITDNATSTALTISSGGVSTFGGIFGLDSDSQYMRLRNTATAEVLRAGTVFSWLGSGSTADACFGAHNQMAFYANNGTSLGMLIDSSNNVNVSNGSGAGQVSPVYAGVPDGTSLAGGNATLVLSDANKNISNFTGAARTVTIPAQASVNYPIGTLITFTMGGSGSLTIAITTDTLIFSPSGATGSRTLAANGIATARKQFSGQWLISGTGLT